MDLSKWSKTSQFPFSICHILACVKAKFNVCQQINLLRRICPGGEFQEAVLLIEGKPYKLEYSQAFYQVMFNGQLLLKMLGVTQRMLLNFKRFMLSSFNSPAALHYCIGRITSFEVGLNSIVQENIGSPQLPNWHAHCA